MINFSVIAAKTDDMQTASGILSYFPSHVQSRQAWYGHNFMLGGTPIQPTPEFPSEKLLRYVGKRIKVSGVWSKGTVWQSDEQQQVSPMPIEAEQNQVIMRNDGILVQKLKLIKSP
jgi:hypothetical protein